MKALKVLVIVALFAVSLLVWPITLPGWLMAAVVGGIVFQVTRNRRRAVFIGGVLGLITMLISLGFVLVYGFAVA